MSDDAERTNASGDVYRINRLDSMLNEEGSLFDDLQALEADLKIIDGAKALPEASGSQVSVINPDPEQLLKNYGRTIKYRPCLTIKRMMGREDAKGERLQDIAEDILKRRSYRMKWSERSRRRYNRDVDDLADVVGAASKFKVSSALSYHEPEGAGLLGFAAGAAGYWALSHFAQESIPLMLTDYLWQTCAIAGAAVGGALSLIIYRGNHDRTELREEISYVNKLLRRDDSVKT